MGNGQSYKIVGIGDICLEAELGCKLLLKKVGHVPEIRLNLISTGQLDDKGYSSGRWKLSKGSLVVAWDDHSKKVWAYPMRTKDQVTEIFKNFHVIVERETSINLKCVRADNGSEYRDLFENYCRTHGIKLKKTVPSMSSIRVVVVLAANLNLEIEQLDVKIVFLHGDLEEEIYMEQFEGFRVKGKEHLVCRLRKSLYGLKQAP
ncbi:hypothetical protein CRG98_042670 [Punica granatum]|uniref:Integrase catalytic domain-containing protein n=1 Tax=Punica granatum TaxID=22663 RepID=A0A2I0HZ34_PUNGR|nr:hypothetical protein CRG98_042670 [Punica granatum]